MDRLLSRRAGGTCAGGSRPACEGRPEEEGVEIFLGERGMAESGGLLFRRGRSAMPADMVRCTPSSRNLSTRCLVRNYPDDLASLRERLGPVTPDGRMLCLVGARSSGYGAAAYTRSRVYHARRSGDVKGRNGRTTLRNISREKALIDFRVTISLTHGFTGR